MSAEDIRDDQDEELSPHVHSTASQSHVVPPGSTAAPEALLLPFSISNSGALYGAVQLQLFQQPYDAIHQGLRDCCYLLEALGPQHCASQPIAPGQDGKRCSEGQVSQAHCPEILDDVTPVNIGTSCSSR